MNESTLDWTMTKLAGLEKEGKEKLKTAFTFTFILRILFTLFQSISLLYVPLKSIFIKLSVQQITMQVPRDKNILIVNNNESQQILKPTITIELLN